MNRYLRWLSALMALLLMLSFCATAEVTAPDVGDAAAAALEPDGEGTLYAPQPGEDAEYDAAEDAVMEEVEPEYGETEFMFGEDPAGEADPDGGEDIPTAAPTETAEAPQDTDAPEASEAPEATDAPETSAAPEQTGDPNGTEAPDEAGNPKTSAAPDGAEGPEASQPPEETGSPEASEAPEGSADPEASAQSEEAGEAEDAEATEPAASPEPSPTPEAAREAAPVAVAQGPVEASEKQAAEAEAANPAIRLGVGEKYKLPEPEGTEPTTFTSANAKIATVAADGTVKGKKRGTTTVVAARGANTVEYTVEVVKAPKKIKFTKKKLTLGYDAGQKLGEQRQLVTKLTAGSSSQVTYYGYNRKVVSVSADGVVTAVGVGTTKVMAKTYNKKKAKIKIVVRSAPGSVALKVSTLNLGVGGTYAMKWTLPKKTASAMTFASDNPGIVAVDGKGALAALAEGTANVTYTCFNGVSATCVVNVLSAAEVVQPVFTTLYMGKGEKSVPILGAADPNGVCGGVKFSSTKKKIATVSAKGVIKAKKVGSTTIKLKAGNGSKASVKVKVYKAPSKVTLSPKVLSLDVGGTGQLSATLPKKTAGAVTYTSSNTGVAQVDAAGLVTAVGEGSAVITARTYNGKKAKCTVEVSVPDVIINMADVAHINTVDYTYFPIEAVTTSGQPYYGPISVTIDPSDVAIYDNGRLLGKRGGQTAKLTAKVGSESRTCVLIVEDSAKARNVKAIAHRGSIHWPENSLEAFKNFASTGADGVELDIRSTSDGVQVVYHDATYYAGGAQHTLANETLANARSQLPNLCTLDEALDVIAKTGKAVYMNPKETADGAKCAQAIRARGLQSRTLYFCNSEDILKKIYAADASAVLGYSFSSGQVAVSEELAEKMKSLHVSYIMPHKSLANQDLVNFWHGKGCKVCVWTVNDKATMRTLCDMGVDGILTDYPEYCVEARAGS